MTSGTSGSWRSQRRAERVGDVEVVGHVDGPDVAADRPPEVDRLDDGPVDAVDRDDHPLLAMRARDDALVADLQLACLGLVLAVDEGHDQRRGSGSGPGRARRRPRNLTAVTTMATAPVRIAPNALIVSRRRQPAVRSRSQCRIIPVWLIVKSMNTPTAYSGISRWVFAPKPIDQQGGHAAEHEDPVRVGEAIPAEGELAGHVAVAGQDRQQARERVEARVGGQEQEQGREGLEQVEQQPVAVDGAGDLGDDRLALRELGMA